MTLRLFGPVAWLCLLPFCRSAMGQQAPDLPLAAIRCCRAAATQNKSQPLSYIPRGLEMGRIGLPASRKVESCEASALKWGTAKPCTARHQTLTIHACTKESRVHLWASCPRQAYWRSV
jgi:hypothetical protein